MSEPTDLRLTGKSADGANLELVDQVGNQYELRISDGLRATVNQPRLSAVSDIQESVTTTVKEVQARLRAGESMDSISRTTDWSIEKIENYAGPILQERAFIISQALATQIRREPHAPYLETAVANQLAPRGVDMNTIEWNTHRAADGNWQLTLYYPLRDGSPEDAKGEAMAKLLPKIRDLRRNGAAAVDLCYVAMGALDGYFEASLKEWDHAAGGLIAVEAGAVISGRGGGLPNSDLVVCAGPTLHAQLLPLI